MTTTEPTREQRDMRIAIAKDILKQLNAAESPYQFDFGSGYITGVLPKHIEYGTQLQDVADTVQRHCTVCALGACLISKARLFNAMPAHSILRSRHESREYCAITEQVRKQLGDIFDDRSLDVIESAFEQSDMSYGVDPDDAHELMLDHAVNFGDEYPDHGERARAIFANLIANDGEFRPDLATVPATA